MKIDYSKLKNLQSLHPTTIKGHAQKLSAHEGPGFFKAAAAKVTGWAAGAGAEAFLGAVVAPATLLIPGAGELLAPVIEVAAPFAAIKFGGWVEDKMLARFNKPETAPSRAAISAPQPQLALANG